MARLRSIPDTDRFELFYWPTVKRCWSTVGNNAFARKDAAFDGREPQPVTVSIGRPPSPGSGKSPDSRPPNLN
jgi:hypothetical protein